MKDLEIHESGDVQILKFQGGEFWFRNEKLHREDGRADIWHGYKEWWIDGERMKVDQTNVIDRHSMEYRRVIYNLNRIEVLLREAPHTDAANVHILFNDGIQDIRILDVEKIVRHELVRSFIDAALNRWPEYFTKEGIPNIVDNYKKWMIWKK